MSKDFWDHIRIYIGNFSVIVQAANHPDLIDQKTKTILVRIERHRKRRDAEVITVSSLTPSHPEYGNPMLFSLTDEQLRAKNTDQELCVYWQYHPFPRTGSEPIHRVESARQLFELMKDKLFFIKTKDWREN